MKEKVVINSEKEEIDFLSSVEGANWYAIQSVVKPLDFIPSKQGEASFPYTIEKSDGFLTFS